MPLKIIKGGGKPTGPTQEQIEQKINMFIGQMREMENSISVVKRMAESINWNTLDQRLTVCHRNILDTLGYVKRTAKEFVENKGIPKVDLSLIIDNEGEPEDESE